MAVSSFVLCGLGRVPGLAPAGEVLVLCFAKEKYPKERRPCSLRPLRGKPASGCLRGAPWNSLCAARAARTTTASQLTMHARSDAHAHPATTPPQAQPDGRGQPTAKQPHGPLLRSAPCSRAQEPRAAHWAERSNGPNGCPASGSLQDAPRSAGFGGSGLASV